MHIVYGPEDRIGSNDAGFREGGLKSAHSLMIVEFSLKSLTSIFLVLLFDVVCFPVHLPLPLRIFPMMSVCVVSSCVVRQST